MNKMKRFNMNFKWLAATLCLLVPLFSFAYEDKTLDVNDMQPGSDYAITKTGNTVQFNWAYAEGRWNMNNADFSGYDGYKAVEVKFTTAITSGRPARQRNTKLPAFPALTA